MVIGSSSHLELCAHCIPLCRLCSVHTRCGPVCVQESSADDFQRFCGWGSCECERFY